MTHKERLQEMLFAAFMLAIGGCLFLSGIYKPESKKDAYDEVCINPLCNCGEICDCEGCECNLESIYKEIHKQDKPADPEESPKIEAIITMHSIASCPACDADKATFGVWMNRGWKIEIVDDGSGMPGKLYPWYEVQDSDGVRFSFIGRLTPQTFSANKEKAVKNATGTN
jgi:hypothetical protein